MASLQKIHGVEPISSYYYSGKFPRNISCRSLAANGMDEINCKNLLVTSMPKKATKLMSALKHKEAERKRRVRINGQYANLRTILPNLIKRSKASVLAETIKRLKELVNNVSGLKEIKGVGKLGSAFSGGTEMLKVEYSQGLKLVKVMLSCEDKRKLTSEIERAVKTVKGKVVKAEISVMCGWIECVLWVELQGINGNQQLQMLRTALDAVIEPRILMSNKKPFIL